ncbi:MAG TPA: hypothetical protein VMM15_29390 [Bradyrhizobium sp.]|nr:hypothetical protein [Bradyrhizobium sp.]
MVGLAERDRKAAEQGDADAQHNLGVTYATGLGASTDLIQAYAWVDLAAAAYPEGSERDDAAKMRDSVASRMTPDQIAQAKKMAAEWKPKPEL